MTQQKEISDILMSADKFHELFEAIQGCYASIDKVDRILGTAIKENATFRINLRAIGDKE